MRRRPNCASRPSSLPPAEFIPSFRRSCYRRTWKRCTAPWWRGHLSGAARLTGRSRTHPLRSRNFPGALSHTLTAGVAGLRILAPLVERHALVRPLLRAVRARNDGPIAHRLGIGRGRERRPVLRAVVVAVRDARHVLRKGVQRHHRSVSQHHRATGGFHRMHARRHLSGTTASLCAERNLTDDHRAPEPHRQRRPEHLSVPHGCHLLEIRADRTSCSTACAGAELGDETRDWSFSGCDPLNGYVNTVGASLAALPTTAEIDAERFFVRIRELRTPSDHLVDLAGPSGLIQSLLFDESKIVACLATRFQQRRSVFCRSDRRPTGIDAEVRGQVVQQAALLAAGNDRPPTNHLVELARPSFTRQSLLHDKVSPMTRRTTGTKRLGTLARRKSAHVPGNVCGTLCGDQSARKD